MRWLLISSALFASACAPEQCELVTGVYLATFDARSGDCGELPSGDVVLSANEGPPFSGASADCFGPFTIADDNCSVDYDRDCDVYDDAGNLLGSVSFSGINTIVSPTRVEGLVTVDTNVGAGCHGIYDATWTLR